MISNKKWGICFIILTLILLLAGALPTIIIDPYFHYHAPLSCFEYPMNNERYQNDGIVKHFEYNAIITGTSMTQNFKASEFDELFDVCSVKIPFSGGSYKEINNTLRNAVKSNPDIKVILRGLDGDRFFDKKDTMRHSSYPTYLYDDVLFNDVNYILNKSILEKTCQVVTYTMTGNHTPSFDEYDNWMESQVFGKDAVDKTYTRQEKTSEIIQMSQVDYENIKENLAQNVISLAEDNPQIQFYLFFPPYSIIYWDGKNQNGSLEKQLAAEKVIIEILLGYDNIHLFSFNDAFDLVCDLDNYKDSCHYGEWINSQMLLWMKNNEHQLTKDNYQDYCARVSKFYTTYDYDKLFD